MIDKTQGFVVHTNKYAGNFERELCAWSTGHIGDCEVGLELANTYGEALEGVGQKPDDNGCHRPCYIYKNADGKYNSVIIYFDNGYLTKDVFDTLKIRAKDYCTIHDIEIVSFQKILITKTETVEVQ